MKIQLSEKQMAELRFLQKYKNVRKALPKPSQAHSESKYRREKNWKKDLF
jgi:hypothetical protein